MSWSRFLQTGSSKLSWRITWDGIQVEFVTNKVMERTTADDKRRVVGLSTEGLKIRESVDLVRAAWETSPMSLKIVDVNLEATQLFDNEPTFSTYLTEDVTDTSTTIPALDTTGWDETDYLYLNTETIAYSAVGTGSFSVSTRGLWSIANGAAQYHYAAPPVATVGATTHASIEITNGPVIFEGRRVYLYAYGGGDDPQGDGTLVWAGVQSTEPTCTGDVWGFSVDPLSRLLSQHVGGDLGDPISIRGIYYAATAPFRVWVFESSGASRSDTVTKQVGFAMAGFWETQEEFLEDLNTQLSGRTANPAGFGGIGGGFTSTIRAVPRPDWYSTGAAWGFMIEPADNPDERWTKVHFRSPCDGNRDAGDDLWYLGIDGVVYSETNTLSGLTSVFAPITHGSAEASLVPINPDGYGGVPRASIGYGDGVGEYVPAQMVGLNPTTNPPWRLYLSGTTAIETDQRFHVKWNEETSFLAETEAVNTTARYIDLVFRGAFEAAYPRVAVPPDLPEIRLNRGYAQGNLADFMQSLIDDRAQYLNLGVTPDIRAEDFESGWDTELRDRADRYAVTADRTYSAFADTELKELTEQENRLIGGFFAMGENGLFTWRPLRTVTGSEVRSSSITAREIIVDKQWFRWEPSALGMFHTVVHKTGYSPVEDEYLGTTFSYVDGVAKGRMPSGRVLEISPKSIDPLIPLEESFNDRTKSAQSLLAIFGGAYAYLTIEVPFTLFARLLGDVVSITSTKQPGGDGGRGVTNRTGLVVGRSWEPREARGQLTILVLRNFQIGGYTPAAKIDSIDSGASGGTGPFQVSFTVEDYFPAGSVPADFLATGDLIRIYEWGGTTAGVNAVLGTIGADFIRFTTSSAWAHAGKTWAWGYRPSTAYASGDNEAVGYAYVADAAGKVSYTDVDVKAFLFGA